MVQIDNQSPEKLHCSSVIQRSWCPNQIRHYISFVKENRIGISFLKKWIRQLKLGANRQNNWIWYPNKIRHYISFEKENRIGITLLKKWIKQLKLGPNRQTINCFKSLIGQTVLPQIVPKVNGFSAKKWPSQKRL